MKRALGCLGWIGFGLVWLVVATYNWDAPLPRRAGSLAASLGALLVVAVLVNVAAKWLSKKRLCLRCGTVKLRSRAQDYCPRCGRPFPASDPPDWEWIWIVPAILLLPGYIGSYGVGWAPWLLLYHVCSYAAGYAHGHFGPDHEHHIGGRILADAWICGALTWGVHFDWVRGDAYVTPVIMALCFLWGRYRARRGKPLIKEWWEHGQRSGTTFLGDDDPAL